MRRIDDWQGNGELEVAQSAGGVLATVDPFAALYSSICAPWPPPELLQKLYASDRWRGKTPEDDLAVRQRLGHYCDLQSLNSEDAITWSFFGPLIYGNESWRQHFAGHLFRWLDLPEPSRITIWLWRRIPHVEKLASNGGPEIDVGFQSETTVILGEAKWNSHLGRGQGVAGNRSQLDLRTSFCNQLGMKWMPSVSHWSVLGIGRASDVLDTTTSPIPVANCRWRQLLEFLPDQLSEPLTCYLDWKERYSTAKPSVP